MLVLLPLLAMMLGAEAPVGAVFFVEPMVLPIPSRARRGVGARRGATPMMVYITVRSRPARVTCASHE